MKKANILIFPILVFGFVKFQTPLIVMDMHETKTVPFSQIFHQKIPTNFNVQTNDKLTVSVQYDNLLIWSNRESAGYHLCSVFWDTSKMEIPILVRPARRVQFAFFPENRAVRSVSIVGDFNDWDPNENRFVQIGEDFVLDLWLPIGTFRYLLEIDGIRIPDPMNPDSSQIQGEKYSTLHIAEERSSLQIVSKRYSGGRLLFSVIGEQTDAKIEKVILMIDNQTISPENYRLPTHRNLEIILPKEAQFGDHRLRIFASDNQNKPLEPLIVPMRNGKPFKKRNKHWFSWRDAIFTKFSNTEQLDSLRLMEEKIGQISEYANTIIVQDNLFTMNEVAAISNICKKQNVKIIISVQAFNTKDVDWISGLSSYIDSTGVDGIILPNTIDNEAMDSMRQLSQKHGKIKPFIILENSEFGYKELNGEILRIHSDFNGLSAWWQANHALQQSCANGLSQTVDPWRFGFRNHDSITLDAETFNDTTEITDSLLFEILEEILRARKKQLAQPLLGLMVSASGFPMFDQENDEKLVRKFGEFCRQNSAFLHGEQIPYLVSEDVLLFFRNDFHHTILVAINLGTKEKEMDIIFPEPFRSLVFRPILETRNPTLYGSHPTKIRLHANSIEFYRARKP